MKIAFKNSYISKKGNPVFAYRVSGTTEELAAYRQLQGTNLAEEIVESVDDKGKKVENRIPLFFSSTRVADGTPLVAKRDGTSYYAETELLESRVQRQLDKIKAVDALLKSGASVSEALLERLLG